MTMTTEEAVTALQASCLPCELAAAREEMSVPEEGPTQKWEGVLTYEGQNTGDGRVISPNALRWDTLPIPLRWVQSDTGGHDGAVVVGRITEIERRDDGAIYGFGDFDMESEAGREAARQVEKGLTPGVSVDLDDVSFEVRVASEASEFINEDVELALQEPDEDGRVKVASQAPDDELMITTDGRIRAATLVAIPAFEPSRISLAASIGWDEARHPRVPGGNGDLSGRFIDGIDEIFEDLDDWYISNGAGPDGPGMKVINAARGNVKSAKEHPLGGPDSNGWLNSAADTLERGANSEDSDFTEKINDTVAKIREFVSVDWEGDGSDGDGDPFDDDTSLNEELDEEERAAQDAEDAEIKTVGDFMPEVIKQIDDANPTPSESNSSVIRTGKQGSTKIGSKTITGEILLAEMKNHDAYHDVPGWEDVEVFSKSIATDTNDRGSVSTGRYILRGPNGEVEVSGTTLDGRLEPEGSTSKKRRDFDAAVAKVVSEVAVDEELTAEELEEFNWVEDTGTGHLPQYIKRIAKHLEKKGMTQGHAIATAVNAVKKMCATGDINFPGKQQVNVGSQAEACAAVAEWEAKKAQAKADAAETDEFREVSTEERERLAKEGEALPDGSYPIANCGDLKNAIQAIGRAKDPAAARAHIKKRAGELDCDVELPESITAAAFPLQPPSGWFADPGLDGPTPLKVTPDGRVYGHLAVWGTCHTAFPGQCVTPPTSPSNYSYFRTGSVYTDEGTEQNTGVITMDTLHAGKNLSAVSTLAHYEHTGRAIADVNVGEDAYGIWVAGALRPGATDDQVRALRGAPLSGDWRKIGSSGLELVAALAVNVPGFPIPRPQGLAAGGAMQALVAAGMLAPTPPTRAARRNQRKSLSEEDYAYLKRLADRERALVEAETAQMAREVLASDLASSIGL